MNKKAEKRCINIILVMILLMLSGCAWLQNMKVPGGAKEQPRLPIVQSRIDSLVAVGIPTDTLILEIDGKNAIFKEALNSLSGNATVEAGYRGKIIGYRVQIASSLQSKELEALIPRIEREMERRTYIQMLSGRFCLRVGDFRERFEAEEFQKRAVSFGFKYAWVVQTEVSPPR